MVKELLVTIACMNNQGCTESTSSYLKENPQYRQFIRRKERSLSDLVGPYTVALLPSATLLIKGRGTVNITKLVSLQFSQYETTLNLSISF